MHWLLLLILATPAELSDPAALFSAANAAYDAGNFPQAIATYEDLITDGQDSGWVYYNLGNAYLRQSQLGRAVAAYRRAEARLPRSSDVQANLRFARQQTKDALAPSETPPLLRNLFFWHYGLSYHELTYVTAIVNGFFWLGLGMFVSRRQSDVLRWGSVSLGMMLLFTGISLTIRSLAANEVAVVVKPEVEVHSGTNYDTVVRFKLHEGTESHIVDSEEAWLRIELSDGKQGWVAVGDVARVIL